MKIKNYKRSFGEIKIELEIHFKFFTDSSNKNDISGHYCVYPKSIWASKFTNSLVNYTTDSAGEYFKFLDSEVEKFLERHKYDETQTKTERCIIVDTNFGVHHPKSNSVSFSLKFMVVDITKNGRKILNVIDRDGEKVMFSENGINFGNGYSPIIKWSQESEDFLISVLNSVENISCQLKEIFSISLEDALRSNEILEKRVLNFVHQKQLLSNMGHDLKNLLSVEKAESDDGDEKK